MNRRKDTVWRSIAVLGTLATTGCIYGSRPPSDPPPATDHQVRAPFETVWQRTVAFFAENRIPIQSTDNAGGQITSSDFPVPQLQAVRWIDCGRTTFRDPQLLEWYRTAAGVAATMDFNVSVRPNGQSTTVRVEVGTRVIVTDSTGSGERRCVSSGGFERELLGYVGDQAPE